MSRRVVLEPRQCEPSIKSTRVRDHSRKVFEELAARFEIFYAWGVGATGDHAAGRALDLMAYAKLPGDGAAGFRYDSKGGVIAGAIRPGWTVEVADYVWANRARLGVDYEIHNQVGRSTNPGGSLYSPDGKPRPYSGESHANHVHISFEVSPPDYRPPSSELPREATAMSWQEKLQPTESARKLAGWPEGFESTAENFEVGTHARIIEMRRYLENSYQSMLENMQQEDPRWEALAAWQAGIDTKLDQVLAVLGELSRVPEGGES